MRVTECSGLGAQSYGSPHPPAPGGLGSESQCSPQPTVHLPDWSPLVRPLCSLK